MMAKSLDGLHPTLMRPRVEALLADPEARAIGLYVVSAFRSDEYQRALWEAALAKYGDPEIADNWVARPGQSNHGPRVDGYGTAVDLGIPGVKSVSGQWPAPLEETVNRLAAKHGLYSPMNWEDWHFEPIKDWVSPRSSPSPTFVRDETEDEMLPDNTVVDSQDCTVPGCPGWWELHADGHVYSEGHTPDELGDHYFGSVHEPWMTAHWQRGSRFKAIAPRRGAIGYTTWGVNPKGDERVFHEFGPGVREALLGA